MCPNNVRFMSDIWQQWTAVKGENEPRVHDMSVANAGHRAQRKQRREMLKLTYITGAQILHCV